MAQNPLDPFTREAILGVAYHRVYAKLLLAAAASDEAALKALAVRTLDELKDRMLKDPDWVAGVLAPRTPDDTPT